MAAEQGDSEAITFHALLFFEKCAVGAEDPRNVNGNDVVNKLRIGGMLGHEYRAKVRDDREFMAKLVRGAENGSVDAQLALGFLYINSDNNESVKWLTKAGNQGSMLASSFLSREASLIPNEKERKKWLILSAEQGDFLALGELSGLGVKGDPHETIKWRRKMIDSLRQTAISQGYPFTQTTLGMFYLENGPTQDIAEGLKWIGKAIDQDFPFAKYALGSYYLKNENFTESAKWARSGAEQGDPNAQLLLAYLYLFGNGVEQNIDEGIRWIDLAVAQGFSEAQHLRGMIYAKDQNYSEAAKLFKAAAENGYEDSRLALELLQTQEGVDAPQSPRGFSAKTIRQ